MTRPRKGHGDPIGLRFALRGLAVAWRDQANLRIESAIGVAAIAATIWLNVSLVPVLLVCGLVLVTELMNTVLEAIVDLVSPDHHPLAARAKDVSAGAVLVAAATAVAVGLVHLGPPLADRLSKGTP
ncbi:MAG: diacylglycerol kinase [Trueperaceae bacterium]|nr:diacylglycerol kinase [Trueperaceae bacterium]